MPDLTSLKLTGKVAVITGGNSGIGQATAAELAQLGAKVVISGRDEAALEQTAHEIGNDTLAVRADVTKGEEVANLFEQTQSTFGKVDILFVNAGVIVIKPMHEISEDDFDRVMDINFKGAYMTLQKALPYLNDGASIVLNTSINAVIGMPGTTVYAASKAALSSLIRTLSAELLERRIRVNAVSPGPVETPIFGTLGMNETQTQAMAVGILDQVPIKRFGQPGEIAKVVAFLASDDASFILGTEVTADGGMSQL